MANVRMITNTDRPMPEALTSEHGSMVLTRDPLMPRQMALLFQKLVPGHRHRLLYSYSGQLSSQKARNSLPAVGSMPRLLSLSERIPSLWL
jgi:hypothetical protein